MPSWQMSDTGLQPDGTALADAEGASCEHQHQTADAAI